MIDLKDLGDRLTSDKCFSYDEEPGKYISLVILDRRLSCAIDTIGKVKVIRSHGKNRSDRDQLREQTLPLWQQLVIVALMPLLYCISICCVFDFECG